MSLFNNLKRAFSGKPKTENVDMLSQKGSTESESGRIRMGRLITNETSDFQLLLSIYRQHKADQHIDFMSFVKQVNPEAMSHKCPYCGTVHEFTASRARKCPKCAKNMIVRQGLFVTEEQSKKIEILSQDFYKKEQLITRMGYLLESVQRSRIQKNNLEYMRSLAETFRYTAQFENQWDGNGYSFWDKAWHYYNKARLEAMKQMKDKNVFPYTSLPSISWDMAQMLSDQAGNEEYGRMEKGKKRALIQTCMALAEAAQFNVNPFFLAELYGFSKKLIAELKISTDEFKLMATNVALKVQLKEPALNTYENWVSELSKYEIIR